jgi:hemerythrin
MSAMSEFNTAANAETELEHQVQLDLLHALHSAVDEARDAASVAEILEQLMAYSEAHFMSEELLMRLKSYDDYEDHVDDHVHMLDALKAMAEQHAQGQSALVPTQVHEALAFIGKHIASRDKRFADFVRNGL